LGGLELRIWTRVQSVEKIAAEIEADTKSGATALAARALDALEALAKSLDDNDPEAEAKTIDLAFRLDKLRPSMGAIGVQAVLAAAKARVWADDGLPWPASLVRAVQEERESLLGADQNIAALALDEIGPGGVIATCSYSQTAQVTLLNLKPGSVIIGEGHKMGDGARAAGELAAKGLDVCLTPDGALPAAVQGARAALIGADQVLGDGSVVNRCSSFSLALAASYWNVPLFVVCHSIKLTGRKQAVIEESATLIHELPRGVVVSAPIFDVTPARLVHRVITEKGSMTPEEAGRRGLVTADLSDRILGKK
jgi:translation initiation factor 2B subunit (eIF-2B alpha/beta/delta family)